jgi:hypothetical protein
MNKLFKAVLGLTVAAGATALPALAATPAYAVAGLQTVVFTGPITSNFTQAVTAPCPSGTRAVGGGAWINDTDRVKINAAVPTSGGFTVLGVEPTGGAEEDWFIVVQARCAPLAALPGLEYRTATTALDSAGRHKATAFCPTGKRLIGFGGSIDSNNIGQDRLVLTVMRPDSALTNVVVDSAETENGFSGNWRAGATVVCVNPVGGLRMVTDESSEGSTSPRRTQVACPAGTAVHAAGFDIGSASGQAFVSTYLLDTDLNSNPNVQGAELTAREDATGYGGSWRAPAYAICAA